MAIKYRRSLVTLSRLLYLAGLVLVFYFGWQSAYSQATFFDAGNYVVLLSYSLMLLLFMNVYGGLRVGSLRITNLLLSCTFALLFTDFLIYLELCLIARVMLDALPIVLILGAQLLLAVLGCFLLNTVYFALNSAHQVVAVYDLASSDATVVDKMEKIHARFHIAKRVDASLPLAELMQSVDPYDSVLLCAMDADKRQALFHYCYRTGKRINVLPCVMDLALSASHQTQLYDTPVLLCKNRELTPEQRLSKRCIDIALSLFLIVLTGPIMLITALLVKLEDRGPVFYRQERLTLGSKRFSIIKFRSMRVGADDGRADEALRAVTDDERITRIGALLRPYRLDELPQLFNVLAGDMSIVGPRPERVEHYALYTEELPDFSLRLRAKAGLTGYAQIYGRYNTSPRDKLSMDLCYIEDFSILQDFRLMFMTLKVLFIKESSEAFEDKK